MKRSLFYLAMLLVLFSCSSDNTYYLRTDDAEGVTAGAPVYRQGVEIGTVEKVSFAEEDVLIEIEIQESLFEGQDFDLGRGPDGAPAVELGKPRKDANELKPGSTLEEKGFGDWFGDDLETSLEENMEGLGRDIEISIEEVFGKDGVKLERKMQEIFGRDGEKLKAALEKTFGQNGGKIEESLEKLFGKNGEKLEHLAEEFGAEFKEIGDEIKRLEEKHGKDTPEFEAAVKKALRDWADSTN